MGILPLWFGTQVWEWAVHYFVITSRRLMLSQGVIIHKVNFIPLDKVTDVEFRRSSPGRLLGYGEFEIMSPGQDEDMRHIRFIPYPEQIYLEICGQMFRDKNQDTKLCRECAMNIPTAARRCPYCTTFSP